jgi:hypothetical protein
MRLQANAQRGATLVVAMVMLLLFTLLISGAFTMGTVNLKAVGNMQWRDEALAAANVAIEKVIGSPFTDELQAESHFIDINKDDIDDYVVNIAMPECVRATISSAAPKCSVDMPICPSDTWDTVWDIRAVVADESSGARVVVRSGVRVLLSDTRKKAVCPDP